MYLLLGWFLVSIMLGGFNEKSEIKLPGEELVGQGISDLLAGEQTVCSLLLLTARLKLKSVGIVLPEVAFADPEITLFNLLSKKYGNGAHSKYNALRRRLLSFISAARPYNPN